jgi:hypothetical protein
MWKTVRREGERVERVGRYKARRSFSELVLDAVVLRIGKDYFRWKAARKLILVAPPSIAAHDAEQKG